MVARRRSVFLAAALIIGLGPPFLARAQAQTQRPFRLGFTPQAPVAEDWGAFISYGLLAAHSDIISHTLQDGVPWIEARTSSDVSAYPPSLQQRWHEIEQFDQAFVPAHARYVSLQPIDPAYAGLAGLWGTATIPPPSPWNTYAFNNDAVKAAYLNYAIAAIKYFKPHYLGLSVECNVLLARHPERWAAFKELNAYVYSVLKWLYPDVVIFSTVQYEHMQAFQDESLRLQQAASSWYPDVLTAEVRDLLRFSDVLALSTYPYMATYHTILTAQYYDAALALASETGKPIAIEQSGYTSQTITVGDATLLGSEGVQSVYVGYLLQMAADHQFLFVINFLPVDYGTNYGVGTVETNWSYTGLWRQDGTRKPALDIWDSFQSQLLAVASSR
jgi:hypothetical protein